MRRYSIGASLLDLNDPSKVIGQLKDPLIVPEANERECYVPNVVYTCGAILNGDLLMIPYPVSDSATTSVAEPLAALTGNGGPQEPPPLHTSKSSYPSGCVPTRFN